MPRVNPERRPIVERVADKCLFFLSKGDRCPTVGKILRGLNGEVPFGADQPRKFLAEVRRRIETIYETPVCSVGPMMYERQVADDGIIARESFLLDPPKSDEEAKSCLPGGHGGKLAGLYFPEKNDKIYEQWCLKYTAQGLKQTTLNIGRIHDGVKQKVLSKHTAPKKLGELCNDVLGEAMTPFIERLALRVAGLLSASKSEKSMAEED